MATPTTTMPTLPRSHALTLPLLRTPSQVYNDDITSQPNNYWTATAGMIATAIALLYASFCSVCFL